MKQKSLLERISEIERDYALDENRSAEDVLTEIFALKYCLSELLTLADFVPCKDGIPLEKPAFFTEWTNGGKLLPKHDEECFEYHQALDKVVYEGFRVVTSKDPAYFLETKTHLVSFSEEGNIFVRKKETFEEWKPVKTREDMVGFEMREQWYKKYFNN